MEIKGKSPHELVSNFILRAKELVSNKHFLQYVLFFSIIFFIFLANSVHESYPDEFDNILGGWNLIHGNFLYSNYFTHHGPVAYLIAGLVEIFSGNSFFRFRIIYSLFLFLYILFTYKYFKNKFGYQQSKFYLLFILFVAIGATYFWGHMLLADNISAFFLTPVVGLLILNNLHKKKLTNKDLISISLLTFFSLLSSLTFLYLILSIYLFTLLEYKSSNDLSIKQLKSFFSFLIIFLTPMLFYLMYLIVTGSLFDYFYQNVVFNQKYYIYNYPRMPGETHINPLRFAIIIAESFLMRFFDLLAQVKDFNFYFPFNISLAVGNIVFILYLYLKRKYKVVFFFFIFLIYANGRSNPLTSSERDYQSSVYILFSLFFTCYVVYELFKELKEESEFRERALYLVLYLLVFIFAFANFQFLGKKFILKAFDKYMGNAPLIYDRPQIAPILNASLTKDDYTWIGPFEFEELFYTKIKNASKYQIFNPGMGRSEKIHSELIKDFELKKPRLIWFDKKFYILGENPEMYGRNFIAFVQNHYITLYDYRDGNKKFVSVRPIDQRTDIETKLYFRKDTAAELIEKLVSQGVIKEVSVQ